MKNSIQKLLNFLGLTVQSVRGISSLDGAFKQLQKLHIRPSMVIDGGASDGRWTNIAQRYFPKSSYILIEPLQEYWETLATIPNVTVVQGALSDTHGQKTLYISGEGYSSLKESNVPQKRIVEAYSINDFLSEENTLLKLDLDGQELIVLPVADLSNVVAVIIEVTPTTLPTVSTLLWDKGFICSSIFGLNYGPKTVLAQFDALFVRKEFLVR